MSRALVAYATRMGATREIAEAVAERLVAAGHDVRVEPAATVTDVRDADLVVLGSGIYGGRWHQDAVRMLAGNLDALRGRRVWLFHDGPIGARWAHQRVEPPSDVARLAREIGADGPVTFGGRLERQTAKGLVARMLARTRWAGDFRDWDRIRQWADAIAAADRS